VVPRPPPVASFSLCGLRLFVIKRIYHASLLWSPGPRPLPVFRSAICDCLSLNVSVSLSIHTLSLSLAAGLEPPRDSPAQSGSPPGRDPEWDQAGTASCRAHPSPADLINVSTRVSYTAHWEALGCALCLLTTPEISSTSPVEGRGFCPGFHRPRARVPLVVWAWDLWYAGFLPRSPGPCCIRFFALRSATVCQ
jgi:hypothetical protein